MRRKDREVTDFSEIIEIMKKCDVVRLGLNGDDGYPYVLPLNFGMDVEGDKVTLYFHSALSGHKVDLMNADPKAAFEMDCDHELQYTEEKGGHCSFAYASVMGKGKIAVLSDDEKIPALKKIMAQYHGGVEMPFNPAAVPRTLVYKLEVEEITAKRKQ